MDTIQRIIKLVSAWQGKRDIQTRRIGGLTNVNYRVIVDGETYALRISGNNTKLLGINRKHELESLQAAAKAGVAAPLLDFLQPEGHLVTRWVKGRHWTAEEFRTPEHVKELVDTVKKIHSISPGQASFSPFQRVEAWLETAHSLGAPMPANLDEFLQTVQRVQNAQGKDTSDWMRFCHNDLVSVNYLYNEKDQRITVLDWEFAGAGDLYYDLACVVYTHDSDGPLPEDLEEYMLVCYFDQVTPLNRCRLQGMKYMLMLFSAVWGLMQFGMQQAGLIPAPEDFDYLEFAQYLFDHDLPVLQSSLHEHLK